MTPDEYCKDKAAKSGSSFYYSFLFLPELQRQAIIALYAFCREVDDIVDEAHEPEVARTTLEWWRQEIKRTFKSEASHPVGKALQTAIQNFDLHEEYFMEIIDGMTMDLEQFSYSEFKHLALYCHRAASVVGLLSVEIFGYQDRKTLNYAENLGMALQLTNIIRDVREDAERGRIYLPQDELRQFNVKADDLLDLKSSPELIELLKFQTARARQYYQQAMQALPDSDRYTQRTGLIMAAIYQATLDEIEQDDFQVLQHRVSLTPVRKLWIAWRTARKEKHLHRKSQ
ncbi:MAG: squalene synthase HpnD [Gammaproteobacteria bacterium]|nr:MAG: squalene synthase HpnD [Gammaproteobacteria bacterium]RKZ94846.1 MAG: squalene synthase HpnD [Gammaproteobacteria bacterium]RKZ95030.1 MAG: squalene synthase HpnD [Gammaproteobacteria bacterium]RLA01414.1 MAG: squalene synthase HpnD [Gammaproteobacteria bacterium]